MNINLPSPGVVAAGFLGRLVGHLLILGDLRAAGHLQIIFRQKPHVLHLFRGAPRSECTA